MGEEKREEERGEKENLNRKLKDLEDKIRSLEEAFGEINPDDKINSKKKEQAEISKELNKDWVLIENDDTIIKSRPSIDDSDTVNKELGKMDWNEIHTLANKFRKKT